MLSNRDVHESRRWVGWPVAVAAIGAFLLVGSAAPAKADSNFSRGFEDQMGRILAYEAVNLGKHVLFQGVAQSVNHRPYRGDDHRYDRDRRRDSRHYYRTDYRRPQHNHWREHDHDREYYKGDRNRSKHRRHWRHKREHRHDRHCKARHRY